MKSGTAMKHEPLFDNQWLGRENKYQEITDYIAFILESANPFEQTWMISYELPVLILECIKNTDEYQESDINSIKVQINQWCSFMIDELVSERLSYKPGKHGTKPSATSSRSRQGARR